MKFAVLCLSFFLLALLVNCGAESVECPSSGVNLGTQTLDAASIRFQPYAGEEVLVFTNEAGDQLTLVGQGLLTSFNPVSVRTNCSDFFTAVNDYYDGEFQSLFFENAEQTIQVEISLGVYSTFIPFSRTEGVLFDFLQVRLRSNDSAALLSTVTSGRGNENDPRLVAQLEELSQEFRLIGDIELLGRSFTGVYQSQETGSTSLYYAPDIGIVALIINDEVYVVG